jgi:putative transposase
VKANHGMHPAAVMCRTLGVSESGYHAWRTRPPSRRARRDVELTTLIRAAHDDSKGIYGSPNIHRELRDQGIRVGKKRVARLMRRASLVGVTRRRFCVTTQRDENARRAPDLVDRNFTADGPNKLWVSDITYIPTWAGFLYLAVVLDAWSRRIVGWAMATHLRTRRAQHGGDAATAS